MKVLYIQETYLKVMLYKKKHFDSPVHVDTR